jgi:hypothetical protein
MAGKAAKRHFLNVGDGFQFGQLLQQLAVAEAFAGFDVPSKIQTVFADGINRASGNDQRYTG